MFTHSNSDATKHLLQLELQKKIKAVNSAHARLHIVDYQKITIN